MADTVHTQLDHAYRTLHRLMREGKELRKRARQTTADMRTQRKIIAALLRELPRAGKIDFELRAQNALTAPDHLPPGTGDAQ